MHELQLKGTHRGMPIDLKDFRRLAESARSDPTSEEAGVITRSGISTQPMTPAETLLQKLGWSALKFCKEYRVIFEHMKNPVAEDTVKVSRVSKKLGIRVIIMSGLVWNLKPNEESDDAALMPGDPIRRERTGWQKNWLPRMADD